MFAKYQQIPVNVKPAIPEYTIEPDLGNVTNATAFHLNPEARDLLAKNAFVVENAGDQEFFEHYEMNRYAKRPNFITTDSMLHTYHLLFSYLLRQVEEERLSAELESLNAGMLSKALNQYAMLKGTAWEKAARQNIGFFAVGSKLLDQSAIIPGEVRDEVSKELALIKAHRGISESPVMKVKEDYSQYIPRGHYDKSDRLRAYFKAMMWYGRITFLFNDEDMIRSAILMTAALNASDLGRSWDALYEPVGFFVGESDDITFRQFKPLVNQAYGGDPSVGSLPTDTNAFAEMRKMIKTLEPGQINSIPLLTATNKQGRNEKLAGFRFMGQRFTVDAAIFQRLVAPKVPGRMLPKGLDIPAALGSNEALKILRDGGESKYENYIDNMGILRKAISEMPENGWTQNLYWGWLYSLRAVLDEYPKGYPVFMRNQAWTRKDLNAFMGSWTELKHDTILYAKQVYAESGDFYEETDDRGFVEPNPELYARLIALLKMTQAGLDSRQLLSAGMRDNLVLMEKLASSLKVISEKELANQTLTDEEYELIRTYGAQLEHFWLEVSKKDMEASGVDQTSYLDSNPAAIVADVATDPAGRVLEEGTALNTIYVVIPIDGKLRIAIGSVFDYYEFSWPLNDRLTDQKWRDLLSSEQSPKSPEWTKSFIAE